MILPIVTYPNPVLEKKAEDIKDCKDPIIKELIFDMIETLENTPNGMGLAAPQVGASVKLFIIKFAGKTQIFINPKLKYKSFRKESAQEGCLSFPEIFFPVKRHKAVTMEALNRKGEKIKVKAEGLMSRAFQHEIDHLNGILFTSRK